MAQEEQQQEQESQGQQSPVHSAGSDGLAEEVQLDIPVAGLGVDIVEVGRVQAVIERSAAFTRRAFTEAEQAYCNSRRSSSVHYATHFAAKEAVLKALGTGFSEGIGPRDVEVSHDALGKPVCVLHGRALEIAAQKGIDEIHISLSRTHDTAVANAIATTQETKPVPPEERMTTKQQIASAFKELRGMLDGLDEEPNPPKDFAGKAIEASESQEGAPAAEAGDALAASSQGAQANAAAAELSTADDAAAGRGNE